jgi:hypothetical protein
LFAFAPDDRFTALEVTPMRITRRHCWLSGTGVRRVRK